MVLLFNISFEIASRVIEEPMVLLFNISFEIASRVIEEPMVLLFNISSNFLALQLFLKSETFFAKVSHQRVLGIKQRAITKDFRID
jgi:hypothetical protein